MDYLNNINKKAFKKNDYRKKVYFLIFVDICKYIYKYLKLCSYNNLGYEVISSIKALYCDCSLVNFKMKGALIYLSIATLAAFTGIT